MKYINAKFLLPDALVKELQHYIQGGYRRQGASLEHLAEQYCLSIHAIRKIIYQK